MKAARRCHCNSRLSQLPESVKAALSMRIHVFHTFSMQLSRDEAPRCGGVFWGNEDLALIYESEWKTRRSVVSTFAPGKPEQGLQVLFDR